MTIRAFGLLVAVASLVAALPASPALADPCGATSGVVGLAERVCVEGRTAALAPGVVSGLVAGEHAGVRFVAFDVEGASRSAVVSRAPDAWSGLLPAGLRVGLRAEGALDGGSAGPYGLLQLHTPMLSEWRDALASHGVRTLAYVPENAFLVHAPSGVPDLPFVAAVRGLPVDATIEPGLVEEGGVPLVHVLAPGGFGAYEHARDAAASLGLVVAEAPELDRVTVRVAARDLPTLAATPGVMWIGRASLAAEVDMDKIRRFTGAEALADLPAPFTGQGVVGMVMDSGVEATHPDLRALVAIDGPNAPDGHGTAVVGIAFASGVGNPQAVGMAPGAGGVFASFDSGRSRYAHAEALVANWSGVLQTHSWGRDVPKDNTYDAHSAENDRIVRELDVLVLQSMSNCGPLCARREAMAKNALSVGGIWHINTEQLHDDDWDGGGSRASTGPASDGRIKPDLVGPYDAILTTTTGHGYQTGFGGTSGATPVVAGAALLVHEMWREGVFAGSSGSPSPAMVKALLTASARPYLPHQVMRADPARLPAELMERDAQGWGLPQLATLHAAGATALVDDAPGIATGDERAYLFAPPSSEGIRVALVWSDVPAFPGAARALVNDLDLEVVDALGRVYRGNAGLRALPFSTEGGEADRLNNVEHVFLPPGAPGPFTVRVRAAAVQLDALPGTAAVDQDYALVALAP